MKKEDKFMELFAPEKSKLWRFCLSISKTRDNALDLLQDTIEQAFLHFEELRSEQAFLSFLFTIASRINIRNSKKRQDIFELDEQVIESIVDSDASPEDAMDIKILYECLNSMKYEQKEAIILSEINDLSHQEAAQVQGISLDAFRKRLYRAKNTLRELMLPEGRNTMQDETNQSKEYHLMNDNINKINTLKNINNLNNQTNNYTVKGNEGLR